ncbi:transcriptional regulator, CadC [Serratia sp. AS12]|uniref:winged helix-turn-helix domain-containing protein n=1 Tax=Serratia TaxID=613 RepID=UPI00020EA221|nr:MULTISPECIES: winged helix-turn-helix domain-containing protein [Serratia]AEF47915.1 transcriptional regulator, CadC [Serratia plymuthica AS9]AEF52867.1 transcriptional regulator, CadC [Serratia sp. AS12]AEG30574.1 transcriptional regulator, CadC [Serratia sp. AS13]UTN96556.1 winged helix-turn-helix domain-containing protein [Serratia plymuthica]
MKFIINKRIIFHEDKSTIELLDDTVEPVMLTATLCRVLSLLVKNNNLLLTREFLLSHAWDEYGKSSSNSNLNNYISMIRKIFTSFGESEIIVTVPRQGFMFSADEVNTVGGESTVSPESSAVPAAVVEKKWKPMGLIALSLLTVALIMVTAYPFFDKYDPVVYRPMGKVGSCTINFLTASQYVNHAGGELDAIKPLIESAKFNCNIPATIYYFNSQMLVSRAGMKNAISFLSYCPSSRPKGAETQCENTHEIINKK